MYRRADVPMPKNPDWPTDAPRVAWHNGREIRGDAERPLTPEAIREIRHGYLANITFMDAQIGKVLDELDRQQLTDSTVIVFCSDHGFHLGEHTLWAKTSNFKLDARLPLLIATPKMKSAGKTIARELYDLRANIQRGPVRWVTMAMRRSRRRTSIDWPPREFDFIGLMPMCRSVVQRGRS